MSYIGSWAIDDLLTFVVNTQVFATGVATDADAAPAYRVYEDETGTAILTGTMALLDSSNTAGFYSEQITLSAANGFEKGKCYSIYISATVSSVAGATHRTFQIQAAVDAKSLGGTAQTGRDIGASVLLSSGTGTGQIKIASGYVAPNWGDVGNPTTTVGLSGTTVKTATDVETDTQDIQNRLPAALGANGNIKADVRDFSGTAGTFASGRPEVNASHIGGSAIDQSGGIANVNVKQISTDATAADNAESFFDGTGYAGTNNVIPTVTTLTNAPSDSSGVTTLLSRLSALRAGYLDNLSAGAVALEASLQGLITTIGASAAGVATAVWGAATRVLTAGTNIVLAKGTGVTGFNDLDASGVRGAVGLASANLDTQLDALPTNAELATALGTADDAVLAAIGALNNLSQANVRTAVGLASANLDTQLDALPTATENADALLARDLGSGSGSGSLNERTVRSALRFNRNKFVISGGVLTVYKEDDSTIAFTATITQTAGDPVSASDPA